MLFDRAPLEMLKASIEKVGILVPLTVYWAKAQNAWVILDGQRRWMCAGELGLKTVHVNEVAEPDLVQNIVTMFQIHKLREDWELMPTALKLEVLMRELKEKKDKQLAVLTGLDQAVVARCKKLLSYPKSYQDLMLDPDPAKRVKADFFIELYAVRNDRVVNKMRWFRRDKFTQRMLEKYQRHSSGLKAVTDFRTMKQHIANAHTAKRDTQLSAKLKEFTYDDSLTIDHLVVSGAGTAAETRRLLALVAKVEESLASMNVADYYGENELWRRLEHLLKLIRQKLLAAGRRLRA